MTDKEVNLHRQESVASLGTRLLTSTQSSRAFGSLSTTRQESGVLNGRKEVQEKSPAGVLGVSPIFFHFPQDLGLGG